tara:strand:+ start:2130 stop:2483 length:354 start_codon:yes stop_codon:yes gene_type:complete
MKSAVILCFLLCLNGCIRTTHQNPNSTFTENQTETLRIGALVQKVDYAIAHPSNESLENIALAGTDTRHYVMIRGWLVQTLKGIESQHDASAAADRRAQLQVKIDFLQRAIRRIDLE